MKKLAALASLLMVISSGMEAQSILRGTVLDSNDDQPLAGAHIVLADSDKQIWSDQSGIFQFDHIDQGSWTLTVSFVGYETRRIQVDIPFTGELKIVLVPRLVLEEVVIRALRADNNQPTAQKTLSRNSIETEYWGQDAVLNLERLVPSVLAHSEAGSNFANYSLMRLRGIDQTRINVTLNGIPLNDMIDQGVFFSNFPDFTNSIESVQVQRGVGTSTNGTASYAGSINYESLRLNQPSPAASVQLTAGSFGSLRASVEASSGLLQDSWAFSSRFTKTYSDGYKFHSGTNSHSLFLSGGYFGEKDLLKLTLLAGHTRNELAYLPVFIRDIDLEPRTNILDPGDEDDFQQQMVQLQHSHWFNQDWSLTSSLYYGGAGGDFPFGFDDGTGTIIQQNFPLYNHHFGMMSTISGESNKGWHLDGGLHAYIFKRKNEEGFLPDKDNPYYSDRSRKDELSAFAKANRTWGLWNVFADFQLRRVSLEFQPDLVFLENQGVSISGLSVPIRTWTFFSPKVGVLYQLTPSAALYFSLGRSGREPTRADILGSTVISSFNLNSVLDQDAVRAEYVNDLEVGVNLNAKNFAGQGNFFYMDFENEIAPTGEFIPEGFVQLRQNIKDSYRTGIEVDWQWTPHKNWNLSGQTTFMQSEIKSFEPGGTNDIFRKVDPVLSPSWLVNGRADYLLGKHLALGFSGRYVGESFLELTNQAELIMPDFFIAGAHLTVHWKSHQLALHVNNLFNELYFTNGAPVDVDFDGVIDGPGYLVQAPRNIFGTLSINF